MQLYNRMIAQVLAFLSPVNLSEGQSHSNWNHAVECSHIPHHTRFERSRFVSVLTSANFKGICYKPTGCGSILIFIKISGELGEKMCADFSHNCDLEWRSRLSRLVSKCRVQWSLSPYQFWKTSVCKCPNVSKCYRVCFFFDKITLVGFSPLKIKQAR